MKCCHSSQQYNKIADQVNIPAGIDSGYRLRVAGAGNAGVKGGQPGDLYIFIAVEPHPLFNRDGANLYYRTSVSFIQAILGDEIKVPTLDGETILKVPAGTQPNTNFKLKDKGLPHLGRREKGDFYVLVEVKIPEKLSKEQAELLRKRGGIHFFAAKQGCEHCCLGCLVRAGDRRPIQQMSWEDFTDSVRALVGLQAALQALEGKPLAFSI